MRKTIGLLGAVVAGAGLIVVGTPAYADSANDNGLNLLNGNNISVLPIQNCGDADILGVGALVKVASPRTENASPRIDHCVNAPIIDHRNVTRATEPAPAQVEERAMPLPLAPTPVAIPGHHAVTG